MTAPLDAMDVMAGLVLDDGRLWGDAATAWQWDDAAAILSREPAAPRWHYLTRPRGGSKTTDLAAVAIAWLVAQAPPASRGYVAATDEEQGQLLLEAVHGFLQRTPGYSAALRLDARRLVRITDGASVDVLAADAAGAFGKRPHLTIVDEAAQWASTRQARRMWTALVSAVGKVPGGRFVVLTSAGDPAHWSYKALEHARTNPRWRVHELPGPLPWMDPADLEDQRALLLPSEYAQLHLNEWTAGEDRLVTPEMLQRCVVLDGPQRAYPVLAPYVIGLDLSRTTDRTVATVCHTEPADGGARRVVLDRQQVWTPSKAQELDQRAVEQWLVTASEDYLGARVVMDPYDGTGLRQSLQRRGLQVETYTFTAQSVGRLASTLHGLLRQALLALPDDEDLLDELAHVRLRQTSPGVIRMDHDTGRHDDRAVSLGLAAEHLLDASYTATVPTCDPPEYDTEVDYFAMSF